MSIVDAEAVILDAFRDAWRTRYGYACSVLVSPLQFMQLSQQTEAHGVELLCQAVAAYFESADNYVQKARHPLSLWLRDPLKYLAQEPQPGFSSACPHQPSCSSTSACALRIINEGRAERGEPLLEGRR